MKSHFLIIAGLTAGLAQAAHAADVGVSVEIGQPGFYGRIDIGRFPQPQVINPQPVVIYRAPVVIAPQPLYLRVPPGHAKNWRKHCSRYQACGQPVYFVQDHWYQTHVAPQGRTPALARPHHPVARSHDGHDRRDGAHRGGHEERRSERRDERREQGQGQGRGHDRRD